MTEAAQVSTVQRAVRDLRQLIFSGELAAGSDHLEAELAGRLGMSRTPVREAALILEGQGLVELRARKGLRVLPVSPKDMAEIYDVLTELESLAAEQAAGMGYSADDLSGLTAATERMDSAIEAQDLQAWADADDQFHTELVRLGGNSRVVAIVAMMRDQVRRARALTLFMRPLPVASNKDHRRVLEAIANAKPKRARNIHKRHRLQAKAMLLDLLEKHHLRRV